MKVAFGLKAHSGWAALVVLGKQGRDFTVVDRRRLELVDHEWQKQPYHAAEGLQPDAAEDLVQRGVAAAHKIGTRELRVALQRELDRTNEVRACGVLVGSPMPDWSVAQILAVHFRMHKAEGVLFRDVLVQAAIENEVKVVEIPEKELLKDAERRLGIRGADLTKQIAMLGKAAGPPWGKDQKDAALAAMVALR